LWTRTWATPSLTANFTGSILFKISNWNAGYYDNANFSGANFAAGSDVTFDGGNAAMGSMVFGSTPTYAGKLTFKNIDVSDFDFPGATFRSTSQTIFSNATVDNISFEDTVFEAGSTFSFYDTLFASSASTLSFKNTSFGGITLFASGSQQTLLANADFNGASFNWDSSRGTMFFLQNTGFTYNQLLTTKNYNSTTGKFDLRGMDLSGNTTLINRDLRGSQIDAAKFGGLWGNDFRDSTYTAGNTPSYGISYIDAQGKLGGLNNHTSSTYGDFLIREKAAGSTTDIHLLSTSTALNSGVTLTIESNNDIFASGAGLGLDVHGTIKMDATSRFHMQDGAVMHFNTGATLEITVGVGANFIVVGDYDAASSIILDGTYSSEMGNLIVHDGENDPTRIWKLEVFEDTNQLVLYYDIPEPAAAAAILGTLALVLSARRRK